MKSVSILIPSRGRPALLERLLWSLARNTSIETKLDVRVALDDDDPALAQYQRERGFWPIGCQVFTGPRKTVFPEYYNDLAGQSLGAILWPLNDDCVVKTKDWDQLLPASKGIWYGDTGDTTRNFNNNGQYACFPMLSRAAYKALGYVFCPRNTGFGTDKYLKAVFEQAGAMIFDLSGIFIEHEHIQDDQVHTELLRTLRAGSNQIKYDQDVARLKKAAGK